MKIITLIFLLFIFFNSAFSQCGECETLEDNNITINPPCHYAGNFALPCTFPDAKKTYSELYLALEAFKKYWDEKAETLLT